MLSIAATATPLAATHSSGGSGAASLALIVTITVAGYLFTCWIWPFGNCRHCGGLGKRKAPIGRVFRHCRHCEGTGYRVRTGRHILNRLRDTRRAGTK